MPRNHEMRGWPPSPKARGIFLANQLRTEHKLALGPIEAIEQLNELAVADLLFAELPDIVDALTVLKRKAALNNAAMYR